MAEAAANLNQIFSPIETIISAFKNGEMIIMTDDHDRENEGDLFIAAEFVTPQHVNFMRQYGSGVICVVLSDEKCQKLELPPMTQHNNAPLQTAFTVSIDAKEKSTTGISATERAHTINLTADPTVTADDFVKPGHIFPLRPRKGGVLERAGHTEAAFDLARITGLESVALVEVVKEDGNMARLPELTKFALTHQLKMGSIADLIAYLCMRSSL